MDGIPQRAVKKRRSRPQRNRVLATMLLMAGTHAALAAGPAEEELVVFQTRAAVSIDAMGRPTDIQLPEQLPEVVASFVRNQITQWRFVPPDIDGPPRAGKTYLTLGACAAPVPEGYQLAIDYKGAGPGAWRPDGRSPPPQYPVEAIKQQAGGSGLVQFVVEPDGSATLETVEFKPARSRRLFQQAIEDWVEQLRFMPEEVDGKPVRTRMRMPLHFERRLRGTVAANAKVDKPECMALMKQGDDQRPVALDSPFRRLEGGG